MDRRYFTTSAPYGEALPFASTTCATDRPSSIAYAYVCRYFQVSPLTDASEEEPEGIKGVISELAHFITDRKSTVLHTSLAAAVTDIQSRLGEVSSPINSLTSPIE